MAGPAELPELIREFADMSRDYLLQETVEPAKQLGRYAAFSVAAAVAFAAGTLLVGIAGMRLAIRALPEGPNWSSLGYLIATAVLVLLAALLIKAGSREGKGFGRGN